MRGSTCGARRVHGFGPGPGGDSSRFDKWRERHPSGCPCVAAQRDAKGWTRSPSGCSWREHKLEARGSRSQQPEATCWRPAGDLATRPRATRTLGMPETNNLAARAQSHATPTSRDASASTKSKKGPPILCPRPSFSRTRQKKHRPAPHSKMQKGKSNAIRFKKKRKEKESDREAVKPPPPPWEECSPWKNGKKKRKKKSKNNGLNLSRS